MNSSTVSCECNSHKYFNFAGDNFLSGINSICCCDNSMSKYALIINVASCFFKNVKYIGVNRNDLIKGDATSCKIVDIY